MVITENIRRGSANTMADSWLLLERARSSFVPVLVFLLALYLPRIQRCYAQSSPNINIDMKGYNDNCVEGQTVMLYCDINGVSSASEYEVNWTKGVRSTQTSGVKLVKLDTKRVTTAKWETGVDDDTVTYTLRMDNATIDDSGIYTCQIFYRYLSNRGTHSWSTTSESRNVRVRRASGPLPQCFSSRRDNLFYSDEQVRFTCMSGVDDATLTWMRLNVDASQDLLPEIRDKYIRSKSIDYHYVDIPAEDILNGASFVCSQFNSGGGETYGGNCVIGPFRVLPAPTKVSTTTSSPLPTTAEISATALGQSTELPIIPKLGEYPDKDSMRKVNDTVPTAKHSATKICPEFVYILVPTAIAVVSVILNFYLVVKLRNLRKTEVDKICDNRHCDTRYQSGDLNKDEYCTCGYMLKVAQHDTEV